ncbi:hypothetical protein DDJ31_39380 [Streptomyces griseoviridis]|uniref:Helicase/UvrB N-terminal domain-containing protein n=2 Tax=Streptomyces griseoviridis TaxID=45398 RepID=A0ABX5U905_STRGD|nr:hypothetical protein DDJ31_39380 [Streptomyces griseoviridis]
MGAERQLVVMPCGTGKTHLAVHIAHEIAPNSRSLVVVPTLDLLTRPPASGTTPAAREPTWDCARTRRHPRPRSPGSSP